MEKESLIIIGGGIAGLTAANELAGDFSIQLIEARRELGGRIRSLQPGLFSKTTEAGSEFIHGNLKHTLALLKQAGIGYVKCTGRFLHKENGGWHEQFDMIEGWDLLLKKMKKAKEDMTMYDFLQEYFGKDKHADLRRHAIGFTEGFDIADVKKVTVSSLYNEWSKQEEELYRIPSGYGALVAYLETACKKNGCSVITNEPVTQIDWEKNNVTVYTAGGKKIYGNKCIVTVPVSILGKTMVSSAINFTPPLDEQVRAAQQVGFGTVIKIIIEFKITFWEKDCLFLFSDEIIPTWWTQLPDEVPVLTGWAGGTKAERLSDESEDELLEKGLLSLASIFEKPVSFIRENLVAAKVFNWQKDAWALGAYSYTMPGSKTARKILAAGIEDTIFFAGEAIHSGTAPGTVEAAIINAKEIAGRLRKK